MNREGQDTVTPPDEFDAAMEAFDREILRNENGARDVLIEAGVLVPIRDDSAATPQTALAAIERAYADLEDAARGMHDAYRDYANSADGAGSVQPPVVQRLVEAVFYALAALTENEEAS